MRPRISQIEHGGADGIDTEIRELSADEPGVEAYGFEPLIAINGGELAETGGRWSRSPVRGPQTLDPSAFLIDQHGRVIPPDSFAQIGDQAPKLCGRLDIASKQNEPQGIGASEKAALFIPEPRAGAAKDGSENRHDQLGPERVRV
jgi:hypothetical protein